jgi:hypothetical protein
MARLGLKVDHHPNVPHSDVVEPVQGVEDLLLSNVNGVMEAGGMYIVDGRLLRRTQYGYATVSDPSAKALGLWQESRKAAFVSKAMGRGTLVFMARDAGLTPQLLHNLAKLAKIRPYANTGNVVLVGNGAACVHRLADCAEVDFGRQVCLVDPVTRAMSRKTRYWRPKLQHGESAVIGYVIDDDF